MDYYDCKSPGYTLSVAHFAHLLFTNCNMQAIKQNWLHEIVTLTSAVDTCTHYRALRDSHSCCERNHYTLHHSYIKMIKQAAPLVLIQLNAEPTVAAEGNYYFLEYLELKLYRFNLHSFINFERQDDAISEQFHDTSDKIQEICGLLEHLYPKLYVHVSRQLKVALRTELIICDIFRSFCRTLFKTGVSWPRVVAMFAFASGVVVDCIREGRAEFSRTVVYCVKAFIEDNLAGWVKDQGGWEKMTEHFHCAGEVDTWCDVIFSFPGLMWSFMTYFPTKMDNFRTILKGSR